MVRILKRNASDVTIRDGVLLICEGGTLHPKTCLAHRDYERNRFSESH